jgi:AraC-like DNA-binding protein
MNFAGEKGTISIELVHEALEASISRGVDVSPILSKSHIDPQLLESPQSRISAGAYASLWANLADSIDDEFFGMDSHPMRRGSFRLMCHASVGALTLERALHRIVRYLGAVLDDLKGEIRRDGEIATIVLHDNGNLQRLFTYGTWFILVHGLACILVKRRIPLKGLSFRSPQPTDDSHYRTRFCQNVKFDTASTQMTFAAALLDLQVLETAANVGGIAKEAPANLLVKYRNDASTSAMIRQLLRNTPPEKWPELNTLAGLMHMSGTTLQRRLQLEGLNYQRLKDNFRRDIAIDLLSVDQLTVAQVAERTGFQETSAFHRAFKKWTGVSPGAYRRAPDNIYTDFP